MTNIEKEIEGLARTFAAKLVELTEKDLRQQAFSAVSTAMTTVGDKGGAATTTTPKAAQPAKRSLHLSPKGVAARKLQGQYLGMLRSFTAGKRARIKKVAREQGVAAALKLGNTLR